MFDSSFESVLDSTAYVHLFRADDVPELFVAPQLSFGEGGLFQLHHRFVDFRVFPQFFRHFNRLFVDLCQITEPKHLHLFVPIVLGREFGQFDEDEAQSLDDLLCVGHFHDSVIVIVCLAVRECVVHEVQRIDRLQQLIVTPFVQLADVCFRGVEQHALFVGRCPHHLHFHDELPSDVVLAAHVYDTVFVQGRPWHQFGVQVFHFGDFVFRCLERQEGVQETDDEVRMFAEHFLEGEVGFRVQVSHGYCLLRVCFCKSSKIR